MSDDALARKAQAHVQIDEQLVPAGWHVGDRDQID
jgi:hypothetical protein